jgi:aminoglycoside phosphotransferase family enzyme/predicted kinase
MHAEDQSAVLAFLTDPKTHGVPRNAISIIETHISVVVLAGDRVFKLKRAVRLPYVDFSTVDLRHSACLKEVDLNRRTAPALYRGVRLINKAPDGHLSFDGPGALVDAVVEMVRFDQNKLFDRMAAEGALTPQLLTEMTRKIVRLHATAEVSDRQDGASIIEDVLSLNERAFATTSLFSNDAVATLNQKFRRALDHHRNLLDARAATGKVRRCHGDLHLRNICLFDGEPMLFDCIEFNDDIATIDVLYDLAFVIMDLWQYKHSHANLVFNRYLDETDESDGISLVSFFMALRAAVRAHVVETQRKEVGGEERTALETQARNYFDLAKNLLVDPTPRLVAIGGLSGTGKSSIAALIADQIGSPPGACILSTDRIRKRLFGVGAETRLPEDAYGPETSERVYNLRAKEARSVLSKGKAVIADGVFDRTQERERIEECAKAAGVSFVGVWLEAPMEVLLQRVDARRGDPSDATVETVREQAARLHEPVLWTKIQAGDDLATVAARVRAVIAKTK